MEDNNRAFKGIWIPKEVWESKELTLQQKVMLVEIDSLDNEKGCYASNKYFSEFFGISSGRVSQVINELIDKGYLNVEYIKEDNQILARILKIQSPPYPVKVFRKLNRGYLENDEGGIKYSKGGYLENDEDNNIIYNNINNNKKKERKKTYYDEILNSMIEDDDVKNTICDYIKMRKLIKKPMTDRALTMLINKLYKLSNNKQIQIKILEQSILKNWTDIYPYKEENNYAGYQGNAKTDLSKYDR